jgi:hypothetical protein
MPNDTTKHLALIYHQTGPMCAIMPQINNHAYLVALCKQPLVQHTTQRLLQHFVSHSMRTAPQPQHDPVHVNARVFLSGYMMLFFPHHAMDPAAEASVIVRSHAATVIQRFEQIIYALSTRASLNQVPATLTQGFHILLSNYNKAFGVWRTHDAERLVAQLHLERIVLHNAADDADSKHETQRKIEEVRDRVRILGGQATLDRMESGLQTAGAAAP